jgi:hypothetical protein
MIRFSLPALASVSVLALGLVAAPVSIDLGDDLIGASSAWAKNGGNGHGGGQGGGQGGGHGHGQSGKSGETEVSSTEGDEDVEEPEVPEDDYNFAEPALTGKMNSSAFNSANYGLDTVNKNSAVAHSVDPNAAPEDPGETPDDPTAPEDPNQTPEEPETPEEPTDPATL